MRICCHVTRIKKGHAMTRAVSRRPVTAAVNPFGIYGEHRATGAGFLRVLHFFPICIIFMNIKVSVNPRVLNVCNGYFEF